MFRTVPMSITRSFSLYTQKWYMSYMYADNLRAGSGWSSVLILLASCNCYLYGIYHCCVYSEKLWMIDRGTVQNMSVLILLASCQHIYHYCMYSKKTPDDGQRNCPKHVEFYSKNKFWEISASSWFYYEKFSSPLHLCPLRFHAGLGAMYRSVILICCPYRCTAPSWMR